MINKYRSDDFLDFNINSRWKLQNAKIKLVFAMGLNDSSSLLSELDDTIIRCILENINKIPILDPEYEPPVHLVLTLKGGGKRRKSKRKKSKRKKSKRRKSKRRKSKRRK